MDRVIFGEAGTNQHTSVEAWGDEVEARFADLNESVQVREHVGVCWAEWKIWTPNMYACTLA